MSIITTAYSYNCIENRHGKKKEYINSMTCSTLKPQTITEFKHQNDMTKWYVTYTYNLNAYI